MSRDQKRIAYIFLGLFFPFLTLFSPSWLSISGVSPRWAELWLLPWALEEGAWSGAFGGLVLGIILDSIHIAGSTQIPALIILGYWWGRLGRKKQFSENNVSLGLLAWLGSFISGCLIWLQKLFLLKGSVFFVFNAWAFHTLLSGALITGLLAPLICSWMLKIFFKEKSKSFKIFPKIR